MGMIEDARDVLDTDGIVARTFHGRIIGHFRRLGPNAWDDYERIDEDGGELVVRKGVPVQVEEDELALRMRSGGRVVIVAWIPTDEDKARAGEGRQALRDYFLGHHVRPHDEAPGMGAAAVIVQNLRADD